jgi:hypothetical protein
MVMALMTGAEAAQAAVGPLPITPFASNNALYLLYDTSPDEADDQIVRISLCGGLDTAITGAQVRAVGGGANVNFDDAASTFDSLGTLYFTEDSGDDFYKLPRGGALTVLTPKSAFSETVQSVGVTIGTPVVNSHGDLFALERNTRSLLQIDPITGQPEILVAADTFSTTLAIGRFNLTQSLVVDAQDNLLLIAYPAQTGSLPVTGERRILKVTPAGQVSIFFVPADWPEVGNLFRLIRGPDDTLYASDTLNKAIFSITPAGDVALYLSTAQLTAPLGGANISLGHGIVMDARGVLYVHDSLSDSILRFMPDKQGIVLVSGADLASFVGASLRGNASLSVAPGNCFWLPWLQHAPAGD